MWWNDGPGWGGGLVMIATMVALWGLVILAGVTAWRAAGRGSDRPGERTPERLLDERFARGEIDEEEYTRRRDLLRSGR